MSDIVTTISESKVIFKEPGDSGVDLQFEQYKTLREEAIALADETRKLEITLLAAIAALYAWFVTQSLSGPIWYLGSMLAALAFLRVSGLYFRIKAISEYLVLIEERQFESETVLIGWERHLRAKQKTKGIGLRERLSLIAAIGWAVVLFLSFFAEKALANSRKKEKVVFEISSAGLFFRAGKTTSP